VFTIASVLNGWKGVKNGPAAIKAFAKLRQHCSDARLLMFGTDYAPGGEAECWALARHLQEGIEFCGNTPHQNLLFRLSREADVLLHPSREESFCMAAAEAMALGLPVVAGSHAGALPELVEDGISGLLIDIESVDEIARTLCNLASGTELRTRIGQTAYHSARARYSLERVFTLYEKEYAKVLHYESCRAGQSKADENLSSLEKEL
jgi:glycosyltransferase involved in cell wall biosynthesis